jgi:hypothetical protein
MGSMATIPSRGKAIPDDYWFTKIKNILGGFHPLSGKSDPRLLVQGALPSKGFSGQIDAPIFFAGNLFALSQNQRLKASPDQVSTHLDEVMRFSRFRRGASIDIINHFTGATLTHDRPPNRA